MDKIRILVVNQDNEGGVGFYRSNQPHKALEDMYKYKYEITYNSNVIWDNIPYLSSFNMIFVKTGVFGEMEKFRKAISAMKGFGVKTVLDIDDYWTLPFTHPMYNSCKQFKIDTIIKDNIKLFDYVITTTEIFADEIRKLNKNVFVIQNAIDPKSPNFQTNKSSSDRLRIGMIMGSTHYNDIVSMGNLANKLSKRTLDKIQFVLCGFDLRGKVSTIDVKTNQLKQRDLKPEETVWVSYEKFLTDNYSTIDGNYANFLKMYIPNVQYPMVANEPYMRCWTKDMDHYFEHYNNVDVLLAPLQNNAFNRMKSQLKAIECCFSKTALVASNVGPYTLDLVNFLAGNGKTNENGNAILIDEQKNHKMWHKTIERLADDPDTVKLLQNNIHESLKEKFDLNNVVKLRDKIYDTILTAGQQK